MHKTKPLWRVFKFNFQHQLTHKALRVKFDTKYQQPDLSAYVQHEWLPLLLLSGHKSWMLSGYFTSGGNDFIFSRGCLYGWIQIIKIVLIEPLKISSAYSKWHRYSLWKLGFLGFDFPRFRYTSSRPLVNIKLDDAFVSGKRGMGYVADLNSESPVLREVGWGNKRSK